MDVLELPRPVINFLRTMAKESCRYALSWDIFGGPDSVTLTLTWKLIDDESQTSIINEPLSSSSLKQQSNTDDPHICTHTTVKNNNSSSSPRRSRRDNNTSSSNENASVPAIFRSSRGKSLEDSSIQSTRQITSRHQHVKEQQHVASLERPSISNQYHQRPRKEQQKQVSNQSDQIYGKLCDARSTPVVKCATISSLSSSSPSPQPIHNNPPLPTAHTHHQRLKKPSRSVTSSTNPKSTTTTTRPLVNISRTPTIPDTSRTSLNYTKLKRTNHIASHDNDNDDDDDDTLDPWVKRFECSLEDNDDDNTEHSDDKELLPTTTTTLNNMDDAGNTSGKVKFKTKPDYF